MICNPSLIFFQSQKKCVVKIGWTLKSATAKHKNILMELLSVLSFGIVLLFLCSLTPLQGTNIFGISCEKFYLVSFLLCRIVFLH